MAETTPTRSENQQTSAPAPSHDTTAQTRPREVGEHAVHEVKELGSDLFSAVRDSAATLIDDQRERAAGEVKAVGGVLRSTVKSLDEAGIGPLARYAETAARQIDGLADRLRHSSWREMGQDIEHFARTWPIAYVAAAMGIGFVAGRVLVSATPRSAPGTASATHYTAHTETHSELYRAPGSGVGATSTPMGLSAPGAGEAR
jgi:hypothetical protein